MRRWRGALYVALALAAACVDHGDDVTNARDAIIGGEPTNGDPAVVMLVGWPADLSTFDTCTATVIGDDVLLTAAHCVDEADHAGFSFGVFLGPDANAYPTAATLVPRLLPVSTVHIHPEYDREPPFTADLAIVKLEAPLGVAPLPIERRAPTPGVIGGPARLVGYGQLVYEEPNARKHTVDTVVAGLDPGDTLTIGDLDHRSCIGDSGGPALVAIDGVETVVGVNSYTDLAGCLEPAHYRRTDLYTAFIDAFVPPGPGEGGAGGEAATSSTGSATTSTTGGGGDAHEAPDDGGDEGCSLAPRATNRPWIGFAVALVAALRWNRRSSRRFAGS